MSNAFPNGPQWSWSFSRNQCFENCPRQYWYQYYGYWGGWSRFDDVDAVEPDAHDIYRVKHQTTIAKWKGNLVHHWIGHCLDGKLGPEDAVECALGEAQQEWAKAERNHADLAAGRGIHPKCLVFRDCVEHGIQSVDVAQVLDEIESCIRSIFENGMDVVFREARESGRYTFVETRLPDDDYVTMTMQLDSEVGMHTVHTKLDSAVEVSDGHFVIYDWKTGQVPLESSDGSLQVNLYACWLIERLSEHWGRAAEELVIDAYRVYLPGFHQVGGRVTLEGINDVREEVLGHAVKLRQMHGRCVDDEGYPIVGMREQFPPKPAAYLCRGCNWSAMCESSACTC